MADATSHAWTCPTCGRRVPQRADVCHCGMPRARAEEMASSAATVAPRPPMRRAPVSRGRLFAALPRDIKALVVGGALVVVAGLGWVVFAPPRPNTTPALLGRIDPGSRPGPKPTPAPVPPLKLPWWK